MLTRKVILSIFLSLFAANCVLAQFDVRLTSAFGGITLNSATNLDLKVKTANFSTVGIQADYFITKIFGFGLGADYYLNSSKFDVTLFDYSHSYEGVDAWESDPTPRNYLFTIHSNRKEIVEQNEISLIDFPFSGVLSMPVKKNIFLTTRLGFKVGIPLTGSYRLKNSDLNTKLYFEEWDLELFNIPGHGLYDSRTDWHPEGELKLNNIYSAFGEAGFDFHTPSFKIRLCGYFAYGLNNIIPEHQTSLIYWRERYNNILSLPESVHAMQFGIKIGIGLVKNIECPWEYASLN